ncbi:hypothetical protein PIB30_009832 [Stylosanthes scabra]|uniref:Uncharacterized protein n=1 Tax=Stylosanthes scabra TaxID=79078 RepID=A0ABU6Q6B6_9FABA|nr:hypothetical protein [Stylosanthes scabra]
MRMRVKKMREIAKIMGLHQQILYLPKMMNDSKGDRGRGRGDRGAGGRGTQGRRGRPRKMTGAPLDLGEAEAETSTPSTTSTPVIPTPSLAEGLPAMRMIPTPGSRVQSSETSGAGTQTTTPTQTTTHTTIEDDEPPPPEPDPMPWPPVDNPLPEGEEEDVALEEELARQADRVYLRWDGIGIRYARARPRSARSLRITIGDLCPSSAWHRITRSGFGGTVGGLFSGYSEDMSTGSTSLSG